jgi:type VI secretion system protein ImpA
VTGERFTAESLALGRAQKHAATHLPSLNSIFAMATEPTLDLERLCAPISEESPTGSYLRSSDYDRLQRAKDLRAEAVSSERKLRALALYSEEDLEQLPEQDRDVDRPDWQSVVECCVEILAEHSKDLWVTSWLIEANTRVASFAGLRDGFLLARQIVEQYWDNIHPPVDEEEGYLGTVSQLSSLNGEEGQGTLIAPIESLSLLPRDPFDRDSPVINLAGYRQATEGSPGEYTEAEILDAARKVNVDQLASYGEDIAQAIEAFDQLDEALQERCGLYEGRPVAPASSQIRRALEECQRAFAIVTKDLISGDVDGIAESEENAGGDVVVAAGASIDPMKTQVASREDAFRMLLKASEFFRKTEPHSPVSYMLQQAVKFGRMELPDLLQELINDEEVLKRFAERTGVELKLNRDEYDS